MQQHKSKRSGSVWVMFSVMGITRPSERVCLGTGRGKHASKPSAHTPQPDQAAHANYHAHTTRVSPLRTCSLACPNILPLVVAAARRRGLGP
jgi:hypothetical protein